MLFYIYIHIYMGICIHEDVYMQTHAFFQIQENKNI